MSNREISVRRDSLTDFEWDEVALFVEGAPEEQIEEEGPDATLVPDEWKGAVHLTDDVPQ